MGGKCNGCGLCTVRDQSYCASRQAVTDHVLHNPADRPDFGPQEPYTSAIKIALGSLTAEAEGQGQLRDNSTGAQSSIVHLHGT